MPPIPSFSFKRQSERTFRLLSPSFALLITMAVMCSQHVCELAELVPDLNVSMIGLLVSVFKTRLLEKLRLRRAV